MYAIIREDDGKFYTSMVFGYYKSSDATDYKNRFLIVLNKAKTALIKQHVLELFYWEKIANVILKLWTSSYPQW